MGAHPRTLADDILVLTKGYRALHVFSSVFQATIDHMECLGGKVAPLKSHLFATKASHRDWLSRHVWDTFPTFFEYIFSDVRSINDEKS